MCEAPHKAARLASALGWSLGGLAKRAIGGISQSKPSRRRTARRQLWAARLIRSNIGRRRATALDSIRKPLQPFSVTLLSDDGKIGPGAPCRRQAVQDRLTGRAKGRDLRR